MDSVWMYFCTQEDFRCLKILFRGMIFSVSVASGKWHLQLALPNMYCALYIDTIIDLYQSPLRPCAKN